MKNFFTILVSILLFSIFNLFCAETANVNFKIDNSLFDVSQFKFYVVGFDTNMVLRHIQQEDISGAEFNLQLPKNLSYTFFIEQKSITEGVFVVRIDNKDDMFQIPISYKGFYIDSDTNISIKSIAYNSLVPKYDRKYTVLDEYNNPVDALFIFKDEEFMGFSNSSYLYLNTNTYWESTYLYILPIDDKYIAGYYKAGDFLSISKVNSTMLYSSNYQEIDTILVQKANHNNGDCTISGEIDTRIMCSIINSLPSQINSQEINSFSGYYLIVTITDTAKKPLRQTIAKMYGEKFFEFQFDSLQPGNYYLHCNETYFDVYFNLIIKNDCSTIPNPILIENTGKVDEQTKINPFQKDIYPNPANDFIEIKFPENILNSDIRIYNIYGRTVLSQNISGIDADAIRLDISNLTPGAYIISARSGRDIFTGRVIVIK